MCLGCIILHSVKVFIGLGLQVAVDNLVCIGKNEIPVNFRHPVW